MQSPEIHFDNVSVWSNNRYVHYVYKTTTTIAGWWNRTQKSIRLLIPLSLRLLLYCNYVLVVWHSLKIQIFFSNFAFLCVQVDCKWLAHHLAVSLNKAKEKVQKAPQSRLFKTTISKTPSQTSTMSSVLHYTVFTRQSYSTLQRRALWTMTQTVAIGMKNQS